MASFILPNETRPDLAVGLSRKTLAGAVQFISPILFPSVVVGEHGGQLSVAKRITGNAVVGRARGTAMTATEIEAKDVNYAVTTIEGRDTLRDRDVKDAGGLDAALVVASKSAGFDVIKAVEKRAATKVFTATRYAAATSIVAATPFDALAKAARAVKYYGIPTLVCTETWLEEFVKIQEVVTTLKALFGDGWFKVITDLSNVTKAVGHAFSVDSVLIGDDEFWTVAGGSGSSAYDYSDAAAVVALRPDMMGANAVNTLKKMPTYGFMPLFLPDGAPSADNPFSVSIGYDTSIKENFVDVDIQAELVEANGEAVKLVKLPAAQNAGG